MFTHYLIAACVHTASGDIERLADIGHTVDTTNAAGDPSKPGAFWTLYGRLEDGLSVAIGDYRSLPDALLIYQEITGRKAPEAPTNSTYFELYGPILEQ